MKRVRVRASAMALVLFAATASACSSTRSSRAGDPGRAAAVVRRTCDGVPERDVAPALRGLQVVRTRLLVRPLRYGTTVEGAEVVVAREGRSFMDTSRLVACRAASARVSGDSDDPLGVPGAIVRVVHDVGDVAVVQLRSRRPEVVREISRRVRRAFPHTEVVPPDDDEEYVGGSVPGAGRAHARTQRSPSSPPAVGPSRGRGALFGRGL